MIILWRPNLSAKEDQIGMNIKPTKAIIEERVPNWSVFRFRYFLQRSPRNMYKP